MDKKQAYYHPSDRLVDVFVGASDGITIPFIVVSALYGAQSANNTIIIIATAAAAVGGIVMFVSTYQTGKHQMSERGELSEKEKRIADSIGLDATIQRHMNDAAAKEFDEYAAYAKEYELVREENPLKAITASGYTIGISFLLAGLLPIIPFYIFSDTVESFMWSVGFSLTALFALNAYKAKVTRQKVLHTGLRAVVMATVAGWAAYYIAGLFL